MGEDKINFRAVFYAFWLSMFFIINFISKIADSAFVYNIGVGICVLSPIFYFLLTQKKIKLSRISLAQVLLFAVFLMFSSISSLLSVSPLISIAYLILTICIFYSISLFYSYYSIFDFELGLKLYALIICFFLYIYVFLDYKIGVRLGSHGFLLNPNAISMVSFSGIMASFLYKKAFIKILLIFIFFGVIYLTGSRASMIAAIIGTIVCLYYINKNKISKIKICIIICGIIITVYYFDNIVSLINDYLKLDDAHRGIESGASGRSVVWDEVWNLFLDNYFFGVGFRIHELLLKTASSAHNGYLAMLVEIGVIGFTSAILFVFVGMFRLKCLISQKSSTYFVMLLGINCGYLFLGFFERYFFNFGNPLSVLFIFSIMVPDRYISKLTTEILN